ncbi:hypothetical protein FB451DRAFT_1452242 [Mycena latifolia]|nr:hypothetical protein FB451DRAFT_1452242 [Mycena latifolia]
MAAPRKGTSYAGMVDNPSHCVISQLLSFGHRCLSDPSDHRSLRCSCLVSLGRVASVTWVYFRSTESAEALRGRSLVSFGSPAGPSPLGLSASSSELTLALIVYHRAGAPWSGNKPLKERIYGWLYPGRISALEAGIAELKTVIPTARRLKDEAVAIARTRGQAAWAAWESTQQALTEEEANQAPARKKPRTANRKEKKAPAVKETTATATAAKTQPAKMPDVDPDQIDEYGAYSALAYETASLPTRRVTLIIYDTPGHPKYYVVWLRYLGCFDFSYFRIARDVQAVHDIEEQRVAFQRYCVFTNEFKPETLTPINMEQRGTYILYQKASLDDRSCLGIEEWKTRAEESVVYDFESDSESGSDHNDEDDQDEESESYESDEIQVVSSSFRPSSPSSYAGSFSGLGSSQSATGARNAGSAGATSQNASVRRPKRTRQEFVQGSSKVT